MGTTISYNAGLDAASLSRIVLNGVAVCKKEILVMVCAFNNYRTVDAQLIQEAMKEYLQTLALK